MTTHFPGASITVYGTALAALLEKQLKIPTAPENTSSTLEATALMLKGDSHLATTASAAAGYAMRNEAPYPAGSSKVLRGLTFGGYETHCHWTLLAASAIKTFGDLKGKRLMCERKGDAIFEDVWPAYLAAYGMTRKDVTVSPELGIPNQVTALKEGRTDAAMHYGAAAVPAIVELTMSHPVRLLSLSKATQKAVLDSLPWVAEPHTIPAGSYKGQDADALTIKFNMGVIVRKDVPDDLVYAMAKAIHENIGELRAAHASFKTWTIEQMANSPFCPYHAGALKYYSEKKLLTPESIEKHKALLATIGEKS